MEWLFIWMLGYAITMTMLYAYHDGDIGEDNTSIPAWCIWILNLFIWWFVLGITIGHISKDTEK